MRTGGNSNLAFRVRLVMTSLLIKRKVDDKTFGKRDGLIRKSDQYMDSGIRVDVPFTSHCGETFVFSVKKAFVVRLLKSFI